MNTQPQKILIRGVNWIGDAVLTLPAIKTVRKAFPDAHICLLVKPWVSGIFRDNPDIDEILLYEKRFDGLPGKFRLAARLRSKKFDMAILFQNAFDTAFSSWLARIPQRIGYKRDWRGFLLTKAVEVPEDLLRQHQVDYYQNILSAMDIKPVEIQPYIYLSDMEREHARNTITSFFPAQNTPLVGINPGATYGSAKRWPPENFAGLIMKIINELKGRVIIFGSHEEANIAHEIISEINRLKIMMRIEKLGSPIMMMSGKTSLRQLAALISECNAFITNDSGPMHMAAALYVPVVGIFGSTNRTATGPYGTGHKVVTRELPCSPCMKRECPQGHLRCMTEISADEVFSALKEVLPAKKAVFLDKDGTLIEDKNYLNSFDDLRILPGVKNNLQKLKEAGFKLIGITNQSGIARGIVDRKFVRESNEYLQKKLGIDDFYYCPHHPDKRCPCRKPEPLMILMARLKHHVNIKSSYVIGDKESDVELAIKTGSTGILLSSTPLFENSSASYIAKDLGEAVAWILDRERMQTR